MLTKITENLYLDLNAVELFIFTEKTLLKFKGTTNLIEVDPSYTAEIKAAIDDSLLT